MTVMQIDIGEFFTFKEFDGKISGPHERIPAPKNAKFSWADNPENVWFMSDSEKRPMYVKISKCYRVEDRDVDKAYVDGYRNGYDKAITDIAVHIDKMSEGNV